MSASLIDLVRRRRSARRFDPRPVEPEKIAALLEIAAEAGRAFGAADAKLVIAAEAARSDALRKATVSGWQGKINPWIYLAAFPATMVLIGRPAAGDDEDRPRYLGPAAMMFETVMLAATEMDLYGCWMAGFNPVAVARVLELTPPWRPIAVSPLGYPRPRPQPDPSRRKALAEIWDLRGELP